MMTESRPQSPYIVSTDIPRLIAISEGIGMGHMTELLRPAAHGALTLAVPMRDTSNLSRSRMEKQRRAVVMLIADDDYRTTGPAGWKCAETLRRWARFAIIHGTGARREHYTLAAYVAVEVRRLLFIETSSAGAQLWAGFLRERSPALPLIGLLPPTGAHPITPAPGDVH